jgi:hypothetical protein
MQKSAPNTTTAPTGQIAPFGLRMLPELRRQIEEAARVSGRSMNAEIVARLQASFKEKTLDNAAMFAKSALESAAPTESAHPMLLKIAAKEYAAVRLSQNKEMQTLITTVLQQYMREFLEAAERERAKWRIFMRAADAGPVELTMEQARELMKSELPFLTTFELMYEDETGKPRER